MSAHGLVFVMVFSKFPLAYITIRAAQEWKVDRLSEAARINGASAWTVWRTIEAPLLLPAYCSAAALVFMDTIGDFGLPASLAPVFNFPTLPFSIYVAIYTFPVRFDMAGVLSFYLVLLISAAMGLQFLAMRKSRFDFMTSRATHLEPVKVSRGKTAILALINFVVLLIALGIPFGSNAFLSFSDMITVANADAITLDNYRHLFTDNPLLLEGLYNSTRVAALTAIIGLTVGFFTAFVLTYTQVPFKRSIEVISLTSLAVPGVVLGIGYIFIWNQPWLSRIGLNLYGTPSLLIMASVAGAIPVITRVLTGGMAKIPLQLLQAAQIQGAGFWRRLVTILMPLSRVTLLSAGSAAFGSSVFNLALATMLFPRNFVLLPFAVRRPYATLNFGTAAASTLFAAAVIVSIILFIEFVFKKNLLMRGLRKIVRKTGSQAADQGD
jgi:iron(III) transport system permease protein